MSNIVNANAVSLHTHSTLSLAPVLGTGMTVGEWVKEQLASCAPLISKVSCTAAVVSLSHRIYTHSSGEKASKKRLILLQELAKRGDLPEKLQAELAELQTRYPRKLARISSLACAAGGLDRLAQSAEYFERASSLKVSQESLQLLLGLAVLGGLSAKLLSSFGLIDADSDWGYWISTLLPVGEFAARSAEGIQMMVQLAQTNTQSIRNIAGKPKSACAWALSKIQCRE